MSVVRIPSDVDRDDTLLAGLSARQLVILGTGAMALWLLYGATASTMPLPLFAAVATPITAAAVAAALGQRNGMSMDRLIVAAARFARMSRLLSPGGEVAPVPTWVGVRSPFSPSPLPTPLQRISESGVLTLGNDGATLICRATPLTFSLKSEAEQGALVIALGRFFNGLASRVEVVVRSERPDLAHEADELEASVGRLAHPGLQAAAGEHAVYLRTLGTRGREVLSRAIFLVLREPSGPDVEERLQRRADEARAALAGAGIGLEVLDGSAAAQAVRSPWAPGATRTCVNTDAVVAAQ